MFASFKQKLALWFIWNNRVNCRTGEIIQLEETENIQKLFFKDVHELDAEKQLEFLSNPCRYAKIDADVASRIIGKYYDKAKENHKARKIAAVVQTHTCFDYDPD